MIGKVNATVDNCAGARQNGAVSLLYVFHCAPHHRIDVTKLACDFLTFVVSITHQAVPARLLAGKVAGKGSLLARKFLRSSLTERIGVEPDGMVRLGPFTATPSPQSTDV